MDNAFNEILSYISNKIATALFMVNDDIKQTANEIRIRVNMPVSLNIKGENLYLTKDGNITQNLSDNLIIAEKTDIDNSFLLVCNNSVYSHSDEMSNSYITVGNGFRVGISGETIENDDKILSFKNVLSLNYRIQHKITFQFDGLYELITESKGILFSGPPSCGKTTAIIEAIRCLSSGQYGCAKRVSVIDSRNEISAVFEGIPKNNLGTNTDIFLAKNTSNSIKNAIRVMNPEYIVLDEIMTEEELMGVIEGAKCGVKIILSVHCGSIQEIPTKTIIKRLFANEVIDKVIYLQYAGAKPKIIDLEV